MIYILEDGDYEQRRVVKVYEGPDGFDLAAIEEECQLLPVESLIVSRDVAAKARELAERMGTSIDELLRQALEDEEDLMDTLRDADLERLPNYDVPR